MQQALQTNDTDMKKPLAQKLAYLRPLLLCGVVVLCACSRGQYGDLDSFVEQVKAQQKGRIAPLPEIKTFETFVYDADELRNPFAPSLKEDLAHINDSGLQPDLNREREPLEQYPLDALSFVGHLKKSGEEWGLITAPDDTIYRIQVGNYLGNNYGKITSISETNITLVEIIPSGTGNWIDREASLVLSE